MKKEKRLAGYADSKFRPFHFLACLLVVTAIAVRPAIYGHAGPAWFNMLVHLLVVVAAGLWLVDRILLRRLTILRCGIGIPVAVYVLAVAVSPVFAAYKYPALQSAAVWLTNALLFFLIVNLASEKKTAALFLAALVASMAAAAAHGIYQRHTGFDIMREEFWASEQFSSPIEIELAVERTGKDEPYAAFRTANIFATFLVTALPAAILWLVALLRKKDVSPAHLARVGCISALPAITLACLWFSGSKAGMAVFAAELLLLLIILLVFLLKSRPALRATVLVLVLAGIAAGGVLALPQLAENRSVQFRFGYWESSLGIIREHWATGVGLENFRWSYLRHKIPEAGEVGYPHNSVIQAFSELGFAGGISFIAIWIVFTIRGLVRRERKSEARLAAARRGETLPFYAFLAAGFCAGGALFASIMETGAMEGFRSSYFSAAFMAATKSVVWLIVFFLLARSFSDKWEENQRTFRLLGIGAAVGALGFFLHSLFDFGIHHFAANQGMWVVLACAIALRRPRETRPFVSVRTGPPLQVLLALIAVGGMVLYAAVPFMRALREDEYSARADDMLKRPASRSKMERLAESVISDSLNTETHSKVASIFKRRSSRDCLLRAADVLDRAISLNRKDSSLYEEKALLMERIQLSYPKDRRKYTEALALWDKAIECYPNNPVLRVRRAVLLDTNQGSRERIIADLEYARFLLEKNRDANGEVVHKSLELEPYQVRSKFLRLCKKYRITTKGV